MKKKDSKETLRQGYAVLFAVIGILILIFIFSAVSEFFASSFYYEIPLRVETYKAKQRLPENISSKISSAVGLRVSGHKEPIAYFAVISTGAESEETKTDIL